MQQIDVSRTVGALGAVLAAAAALFVLAVRERELVQAPTASAPEAYERHCAGCHEEQDLRDALSEAPDRARRALDWLERLGQHGSASGADDLALVKWLLPSP